MWWLLGGDELVTLSTITLLSPYDHDYHYHDYHILVYAIPTITNLPQSPVPYHVLVREELQWHWTQKNSWEIVFTVHPENKYQWSSRGRRKEQTNTKVRPKSPLIHLAKKKGRWRGKTSSSVPLAISLWKKWKKRKSSKPCEKLWRKSSIISPLLYKKRKSKW